MEEFCYSLPKAEHHIHLEGTLEPEYLFLLSERNNLENPYKDINELKEKYKFDNLQEFLDIYNENTKFLKTKEDFFDLTWRYLEKSHSQGLCHTELFFDPQTHLGNGIKFETFFNGMYEALEKGVRELGITFKLIMCIQKHYSMDNSMECVEKAIPFLEKIDAIGFDSTEKDNPPSKYRGITEKVKEYKNDIKVVCHAGEEGSSDYIWQAINELDVERIDHGVASLTDENLLVYLSENRTPLTICPFSNLRLKVKDTLEYVSEFIENDIIFSINSDDPAYFGGYIGENYKGCLEYISIESLVKIAKDSINISWIDEDRKNDLIGKIDAVYLEYINNNIEL